MIVILYVWCCQVEAELESSKSARREQTDEFERQVKEIAAAHEKELKSVSAAHDEEKSNVSEATQQQRDTLISNHKQVLMSQNTTTNKYYWHKTHLQSGTPVTKFYKTEKKTV